MPSASPDPATPPTTDGAGERPREADPGRPAGRRSTLRLVLLVVLVLALLASVGSLAWLLAARRGGADDLQAQRDAVMSRTQQFVLRINTYGPDLLDKDGHMPQYRDRVTEVITPKFGSDFEDTGLPIAEKTVAGAGYARTAKIFGVGVESLDDDSATTIVAGAITGSYPDPKHPHDQSRRISVQPDVVRWEVKLVRTGGEWLVDDYTPVTGEGQQ